MSLAHLEVQTYPAARFEIVVVEYGPSASKCDALERYTGGAPIRTRCHALPGTTSAHARNLAARLAEGQWLLFLDEDLLAGPELVGAHVRAQEARGGKAAVVGRVETHPQVEVRALAKRFRLGPLTGTKAAGPLDFADWGFYNLSLPRDTFLEAGGFDEDLDFDGLQDIALAWKLQGLGLQGSYAHDATAYVWRPMRMADERRRQYYNGYSLYRLLQGRLPDEVRALFPLQQGNIRECLDRLLLHLYRHLCDPRAETARPFEFIRERILSHEFQQGFRDAAAGRPPRPDEETTTELPADARESSAEESKTG